MSLINELKAKSANVETTKNEIIGEIKGAFDRCLTNRLEDQLRKCIDNDAINNRQVYLGVSFWEFSSGCSPTYFRCAGFTWYNPQYREGWESREYRGIKLIEIQDEVCNYLEKRLEAAMQELGFYIVEKEAKKSRLGYRDTSYYFGW